MTAGAGLVGCNYVYKAKPDGLTILFATSSAWTLNFLRPEGITFKLDEMRALLNQGDGAVIFTRTEFAKEPKDLLTAEGLLFGTIGPTAAHGSGMLAVADLLGMDKLRFIWGYKGSAEERLAFISGETNMFGASVGTYYSFMPYIESGEAVGILQTGMFDKKGNVVRDPGIPDMMTVGEFYEEAFGEPPSGLKWEVFKGIYVAARVGGKTLYLPPGTPDNIMEILDKAAREMVKDAEFDEDFTRIFGTRPILIISDAPDVWKGVVTRDPDVYESVKRLVAAHGVILK